MPGNPNSSTGANIFDLMRRELDAHDITLNTCVSFGCDNASVMTGKRKGVAAYVRREIPDVFIQGCPCHLIHLAAGRAADELTFAVDELLVDIFYYLAKSSKRKQQLHQFQELCDVKTQKILKHVATRWLSLGTCIGLKKWAKIFSTS